MYKVIKMFHDMQDNNYCYEAGREYPREGVTVLPSRIKELASSDNRMREPLIEEVAVETQAAKKTRKTKSDK